jgi:hypothetical protein
MPDKAMHQGPVDDDADANRTPAIGQPTPATSAIEASATGATAGSTAASGAPALGFAALLAAAGR